MEIRDLALDHDHDRGADQQQKLGRLQADELGIARRQGRHDPDADGREREQQHHIDGLPVGLPPHRQRAGELDQIGREGGRDHQLHARQRLRNADQAHEPEIEEVAEIDRGDGMGQRSSKPL